MMLQQFVLRRLVQTLDHAAFTEQVAEHQHADQRRSVGQNERDDDRDRDREDDLLDLGDLTQLTPS